MKALRFLGDLLRALWLFFPALFFLLFMAFVLATTTIGQDLIRILFQPGRQILWMQLAFGFWSYTVWYSSRLVAEEKQRSTAADTDRNRFYTHIPRVLGHLSYSVLLFTFLEMPELRLNNGTVWMIMILDILLIFPVTRVAKTVAFRLPWWSLFVVVIVALVVEIIVRVSMIADSSMEGILFVQFALFVAIQIFAQFYRVQRRMSQQPAPNNFVVDRIQDLLRVEKNSFFLAFLMISVVAAVIFVSSVFSIAFSRGVGSFNMVFLAFGMMLGLGNILSFLSIRTGVNLHIVVIAIAALTGQLGGDPYEVRLWTKEAGVPGFSSRQSLKEYTRNWIARRDSTAGIRMIFVLSDGGASRSGYWVSLVLGKLADDSSTTFKQDLFCLSGASGGGVGNTVFFSLLDTLQSNPGVPSAGYTKLATDQMGNDFLTPTLTRLLSTDILRHVFPFNFIPLEDRASILECAMETTETPGIMRRRMGDVVTRAGVNYGLPIIYINTTRVQDASPGVVSNIKVDHRFNHRIDVLSLLDANPDDEENYDMNLSTAAVLGSRFPFVSPAGSIKNNYFVDGGYFDNSGGGVVHETMLYLDQMIRRGELDDVIGNRKVSFMLLHLQNNPPQTNKPEPVRPIVNDLAAPLQTLAGSYGQQTNLNDLRLYDYLYSRDNAQRLGLREWMASDSSSVFEVNLYGSEACSRESFPLSWSISEGTMEKMGQCLNNKNLDRFTAEIQK